MIDARELRYGNLVRHYGEIITVHGIDDMDVFNKECGEIPLHSISPIELTESVLLKCGFTRDRNGYFLNHYMGVSLSDGFVLCWADRVFGDRGRILYLHTLQNAVFALTGKELEGEL